MKGQRSSDEHSSPPRKLTVPLSRRELLHLVQTEMRVQEGATQGIPVFRLTDLGTLPDAVLAQTVPIIAPDCRISVIEGWVCGQLSDDKKPLRLFAAKMPHTAAFNQFNGHTDLDSAAYQLTRQTSLSKDESFALVRELFFHLVQKRVCWPR